MSKNENILVIGGAGSKTGRRVAERLSERGVPVRLASRSSEPSFDWEDRSTWAAALEGATAAYITYYPDLAVEGSSERIRALAELAVAQGARRLVLLSGRGEEEAERAEQELLAVDPTATIVRCSWFMQNFDETYFAEALAVGELALPAGDVREPFVDAEDIADVAVAALTEDGHAGQLYELTGPRMLSFGEAVGEIARATGKQLRYAPIPIDAFAAGLGEEGVPADVVDLLRYLFTEVLDGRNESLTDGVQRALGREPRDFVAYADRAAAAGAWSA
ncbi:MAG TPA: NmrA family transcriptional regulator [Solirubrobacteraceae bacterium]|nr:NmrA family transcriptional regulator [Solirubrobacteraceae bacterium]